MTINNNFLKWIILFFLILPFYFSSNYAQMNDENNPHKLTDNPENCLYCHNKSNITDDEKKLKRTSATHKFKLEVEKCDKCHIMDDNMKSKEPRFKKSIADLCTKPCHYSGALGLNHPVEVVPNFKVPSYLPLENGEVTCGTCHNPHGPSVVKTKALLGWNEDRSYFLRMENSHGDLCRSCHTDYPIF